MQVIEDQLAAIATSRIGPALPHWTSIPSAPSTAAEYIVYDHSTESLQSFSNYDTVNVPLVLCKTLLTFPLEPFIQYAK
jgi:hypothetical protein